MFVCLTPSRRRSLSQTIKSYLSAVRHLQIQAGLGDPFTATLPQLAYVLKGIRRQQRPRLKVDKRLPITPAELRILKDVWAKRSPFYDAAMLWAAVCTGFFGFMRTGEFTVSSVAAFDAYVHLAPTRRQHRLTCHSVCGAHSPKAIENRPVPSMCKHLLGQSRQEICPVAALLSYMALRGTRKAPYFSTTMARHSRAIGWSEKFSGRSQKPDVTAQALQATASALAQRRQRRQEGWTIPQSKSLEGGRVQRLSRT